MRILDQEIADRCAATVAAHPDWPCRSGCDHCCRHLAAEPLLTAAEWQRLEPLLTAAMIERALRLTGPPWVCPFLDQDRGSCTVYEARPVACRTYGFYVERELGLYCPGLRERVERGEFSDVVWGNQSGVERRLQALGERRPLRAWLAAVGGKAPE